MIYGNVKEAIAALNAHEVNAPYKSSWVGAFGSQVFMTVAFEPKHLWPHGYLENCNYFKMSIEPDGTMEMLVSSLYQKLKPISYDTRLGIKFRKCKAKSMADAIQRIDKFVALINERYENETLNN